MRTENEMTKSDCSSGRSKSHELKRSGSSFWSIIISSIPAILLLHGCDDPNDRVHEKTVHAYVADFETKMPQWHIHVKNYENQILKRTAQLVTAAGIDQDTQEGDFHKAVVLANIGQSRAYGDTRQPTSHLKYVSGASGSEDYEVLLALKPDKPDHRVAINFGDEQKMNEARFTSDDYQRCAKYAKQLGEQCHVDRNDVNYRNQRPKAHRDRIVAVHDAQSKLKIAFDFEKNQNVFEDLTSRYPDFKELVKNFLTDGYTADQVETLLGYDQKQVNDCRHTFQQAESFYGELARQTAAPKQKQQQQHQKAIGVATPTSSSKSDANAPRKFLASFRPNDIPADTDKIAVLETYAGEEEDDQATPQDKTAAYASAADAAK